MKISESGNLKHTYLQSTIKVNTPGELTRAIADEIKRTGNDADLNHIDVSSITDMGYMFMAAKNLNIDISKWDVSNVKSFNGMFRGTEFDGDLCDWDVANAENFSFMFARSTFDGDISGWDVKNAKYMTGMFMAAGFNHDISIWDVSGVLDFSRMFEYNTVFSKDLSLWKPVSARNIMNMFYGAGNAPRGICNVWIQNGIIDPKKCITNYCI